jgi:cation transport regulator
MPYPSNDKLPPTVRHHLPPAAQSVYREAFNHAWKTYAHDVRQEEIAHRVAWAAVKRRFHKAEDGNWEADAG